MYCWRRGREAAFAGLLESPRWFGVGFVRSSPCFIASTAAVVVMSMLFGTLPSRSTCWSLLRDVFGVSGSVVSRWVPRGISLRFGFMVLKMLALGRVRVGDGGRADGWQRNTEDCDGGMPDWTGLLVPCRLPLSLRISGGMVMV